MSKFYPNRNKAVFDRGTIIQKDSFVYRKEKEGSGVQVTAATEGRGGFYGQDQDLNTTTTDDIVFPTQVTIDDLVVNDSLKVGKLDGNNITLNLGQQVSNNFMGDAQITNATMSNLTSTFFSIGDVEQEMGAEGELQVSSSFKSSKDGYVHYPLGSILAFPIGRGEMGAEELGGKDIWWSKADGSVTSSQFYLDKYNTNIQPDFSSSVPGMEFWVKIK